MQRMLSQLLPDTTLKADVVVTGTLLKIVAESSAGDLFLASTSGLRHDGRHYIDRGS